MLLLPLYSPKSRRHWSELLPEDVACAKDTRDLVIECCVGKTKTLNLLVALILTPYIWCRIHSPPLVRGERDMRKGI